MFLLHVNFGLTWSSFIIYKQDNFLQVIFHMIPCRGPVPGDIESIYSTKLSKFTDPQAY